MNERERERERERMSRYVANIGNIYILNEMNVMFLYII